MIKENYIHIYTDDTGFEYDIYALVKAFYPDCEVKVLASERSESSRGSEEETRDVLRFFFDAPKNLPRTEAKNELKRQIYHTLSDKTGKVLPW